MKCSLILKRIIKKRKAAAFRFFTLSNFELALEGLSRQELPPVLCCLFYARGTA